MSILKVCKLPHPCQLRTSSVTLREWHVKHLLNGNALVAAVSNSDFERISLGRDDSRSRVLSEAVR